MTLLVKVSGKVDVRKHGSVSHLAETLWDTEFSSRARRSAESGRFEAIKDETHEVFLDILDDIPIVDIDERGLPIIRFNGGARLKIEFPRQGNSYIDIRAAGKRSRHAIEADDDTRNALYDIVGGEDIFVQYKLNVKSTVGMNSFYITHISSENGAVEFSNPQLTSYIQEEVEKMAITTPIPYNTFVRIVMENEQDADKILDSEGIDRDHITVGDVLTYVDNWDTKRLNQKTAIVNRLRLFLHMNGTLMPEIANRDYYKTSEVAFLLDVPEFSVKRILDHRSAYGWPKEDVYSHLAAKGDLSEGFIQMQDSWKEWGIV